MARYGVLGMQEEADIAELEAEEMAANLAGAGTAADLRALIRLGEAAMAHDPKLAALMLEIRLIRLRHPGANILVYTEYADSQRAAVAALAGIDGTILTISGADSEATRTRAAERVAEEDGIVLISTDSLAEGLNLHQRCFHLIHLDLPYNPNRLEQRNGRIDRYGQRNDPEIRYLFLAGTFEERLLLRLIAKYEKARACLSFMPNTLGVGADPASLREPLCAGFAEDLFGQMPRLIHSLDLAAEDTDSEAYRDLLREIDRAFQSFDHMAVRHGWLSGSETGDAAPAEMSEKAIDLPAFVASVLTPEGDGYRVPDGWARDLDGLPGFDPLQGTVRLAEDPAQVRDTQGRALLYPGRAHPLTRRAIAAVRTGRVSAARGHALSLLVTYSAEAGPSLRKIFALRLFPDGSITEQADFLAFAGQGAAAGNLWRRRFSKWAQAAMAMAARDAAAVAERIAVEAEAAHRDRNNRDIAVVRSWMTARCAELCGAAGFRTLDLFDPEGSDDWRTCVEPERRLAGFIADQSEPVSQRREAIDVLDRLRAVTARKTSLPRPTASVLGMLMLVP
jgi:hypothetical protein